MQKKNGKKNNAFFFVYLRLYPPPTLPLYTAPLSTPRDCLDMYVESPLFSKQTICPYTRKKSCLHKRYNNKMLLTGRAQKNLQ